MATAPAASAQTASKSDRYVLAGSVPAWIRTAHVVSVSGADTRLSFNIVLPLRNQTQLARLVQQVSSPKSSSYGHYVTPGTFNNLFAATPATVSLVRSFLASQGMRVTGVAAGRRWVSVSATVAQVDATFHTTVRNYQHDGRVMRAPTTALSVPASLNGLVSGVVGIVPTPLKPAGLVRESAASSSTTASCSTYWDQYENAAPPAYGRTQFPTPICGYSPAQVRGAYGLQGVEQAGDTGKGVTVAIVDAYASPTIATDDAAFSAAFGEPAFASGQFTQTTFQPFDDQVDCGGEVGWNEEETLDVEAVHGVAPGASVRYFGAQDCEPSGVDTAVNYILQNHSADIVSNSYGSDGEDDLGDEVALENSQFQQAAAEGIGFYYASGDDGDTTDLGLPPEASFPASDPLVTGVGGTSLAVSKTNDYQFETGWGDARDFYTASGYEEPLPGDFFAGSGGGVSKLFAEPNYQKLLVPRSLATKNGSTSPMRVVPDVATLADPYTGYALGFSDKAPFSISSTGGTSLACPVFAAVQAVASQGRTHPIGFANPSLYAIGLTKIVYHDVVSPRTPVAVTTPDVGSAALVTFSSDSSLTATPGYDDVTGLGSPNGAAFILAEKILG